MSSSFDSLDGDIDIQLSRGTNAVLNITSPPLSNRSTAGRFSSSYRRSSGETGCASCSITLPDDVRTKLPSGAPGSPRMNGAARSNGSPILRSKESIHACGPEDSEDDYHQRRHHHQHSSRHLQSQHRSLSSSTSSLSDASVSSTTSSCHMHTLEFVTTACPLSPHTYTQLRQASIRTLSCEQLPRGVASGPLFFGDPSTGYIIAYKFRLPDPLARGQQRFYAFTALAGHDQGRAFEATSDVWKCFERLAGRMMSNSEAARKREQQQQLQLQQQNSRSKAQQQSAPHSFLTQRGVDPDGYPRGGTTGRTTIRARGLAEILGDDLVFAELHRGFVGLLQQLGKKFGGI